MSIPRISIITTVYNGERYLDEAIESIVSQDFADFEYIIVDDGSTDASAQIMHRWARRDRRIRVEGLSENVGIARAFNHALELARGRYVCRHDADDVCVGLRLRRQAERLESDPDIALVTANCMDIDAEGNAVHEHMVENPPEVIAFLLNFRNCIIGAGGQGMFRTDAAREIGGFNETLRASLDYDFFCRLSKRGNFVVLPFVGLKRRIHAQQSSQRLRSIQLRSSISTSERMMRDLLGRELVGGELAAITSTARHLGSADVGSIAHRVFKECFARFVGSNYQRILIRHVIANWWVHSAAVMFKKGELREAAGHLAYSIRWHPFSLIACASILGRKCCAVLGHPLPRRSIA